MKYIENLIVILIGNIIYIFGVIAFVIQGELITGGSTGIGLILYKNFNIPLPYFLAIFNGTMFLLGLWILGKKFALTTLVSTIVFPIIMGIMENIEPIKHITKDSTLCAIYGGICIGVGLGMIIRSGASTGGVDIPIIIVNKKTGISIPIMLYIVDSIILVSQMMYSSKNGILYGILMVMVYTIVLNKILTMGNSYVKVEIISDKYVRINDMIHTQIDRGTTFLEGETGFKGNPIKVVISAISNRELPELLLKVEEIDPTAFIMVYPVSQASGRGFTIKKAFLEKEKKGLD